LLFASGRGYSRDKRTSTSQPALCSNVGYLVWLVVGYLAQLKSANQRLA
jgi:hypothetical protein